MFISLLVTEKEIKKNFFVGYFRHRLVRQWGVMNINLAKRMRCFQKDIFITLTKMQRSAPI